MNLTTTIIPLAVGLLIIVIAIWRGWLTYGGAVVALAVGALTVGFGGLAFVVPLLTFFVTSSILSKVSNDAKEVAAQHAEKSHQRDAVQVLANGGLSALAALGYGLTQAPPWFAFFIGAMATATADTWATELGTLSKVPPRSIVTGKLVASGISGGVSLLGILASVAGGMLIGCVSAIFWGSEFFWLTVIGGVAGLAGSLIDSLLGATLQRHYWDPTSQVLTERPELDGQPLDLQRGVRWMNNDVVNLLAAVGGGLVSLVLA